MWAKNGMLGTGVIPRNDSGHSRPEVPSRCMNHGTKQFPLSFLAENPTTGSFRLVCSHSEVIMKFESYRELLGLHGVGIRPSQGW
jgi:hypothetical protein